MSIVTVQNYSKCTSIHIKRPHIYISLKWLPNKSIYEPNVVSLCSSKLFNSTVCICPSTPGKTSSIDLPCERSSHMSTVVNFLHAPIIRDNTLATTSIASVANVFIASTGTEDGIMSVSNVLLHVLSILQKDLK